MESTKWLVCLGVVTSLWGCPNGPNGGDPQASFTTSEDINGVNPEAAKFAAFGAILSGANQGLITVVVSDRAEVCDLIGDDLFAFVDALTAGTIPGTFVFIDIVNSEGVPLDGEVIVGQQKGDSVLVGFSVSNEAGFVGSGMTNQSNATATIESIELDKTVALEIEGTLDVELGGGAAVGPVLMTGTVLEATPCQAIVNAF